MKYLIANWKANKNLTETEDWFEKFEDIITNDNELQQKLQENKVKLIICPPVPFLTILQPLTRNLPNIAIGAQNVSSFAEGAYTGEVTAKSLQNLASYVIIGHSERRSHFAETDELIANKVTNALAEQIEPVLCIRGTQDSITPGAKMIAYEPVEAIGTGNNMPVAEVVEKKKTFSLPKGCLFIYGGSVNENTATSYLSNPEIDGLLIGGASLQPESFLNIARLI